MEDSIIWTLEKEKKHIDGLGTWSTYKFNRTELLKKYKKSLRIRSRFKWSVVRSGNHCRSKMKPEDNEAVIKELENYVDEILKGN